VDNIKGGMTLTPPAGKMWNISEKITGL